MFGVIFYQMPSGLVLYWFIKQHPDFDISIEDQ